MLTDIEIAQQAKMLKIGQIAEKLGISEEEIEPYGHYKAKLSQKLFDRVKDNPDGKLILVTAINPTPAGEGNYNFRRTLRGNEQNRQENLRGSP